MDGNKTIIKLSSEAITNFKKIGIGIVYFFGSRVESFETEKSDFDIGIVFQNEKEPEDLVEIHPHLYNLFTSEFPVTFQNDVDILYLQNCGSALQFYVIKNSEVLYEVYPVFRANYEENVLKEYLDFKAVDEIFSRALLERG